MYDFEFHSPTSLEEAAALYAKSDDASYLAGGHTLLPTMKQRLAAPVDLIDLSAIPGLNSIEDEGDVIRIGSLALHDEVATSSIVAGAIPALSKLASGIGDAQVRNRGTMGGSVSNNDPAADYPAAVLGLGATVATNKRSIAADDFFQGMFETALEEGEILTSISYPKPKAAAYVKYPNPASRYATVGVFVVQTASGIRVAITGAAPCVFRCESMESALAANFSVAALDGIALPAEEMNNDMHAAADYRAHLCVVMAKRAVEQLS